MDGYNSDDERAGVKSALTSMSVKEGGYTYWCVKCKKCDKETMILWTSTAHVLEETRNQSWIHRDCKIPIE